MFSDGYLGLSLRAGSSYRASDLVRCAGFSDACMTVPSASATGGVGEAPRHEIAEYGALWLSEAYGDLAAAWRLE